MDPGRHAVGAMLVVVCLTANGRAETEDIPDAKPEAVKAAREVGLVLEDGKGHYIAFTQPDPEVAKLDTQRMFYGDGKTLYRVGFLRQGTHKAQSWAILDERRGVDLWKAELALRDGAFTMTCRSKDNVTALTALSSANARELLAKATFKERRMDRRAFALGRDGTTYYYVDYAVRPEVNTDFRLYVGKRGGAKRLKLKHIASDSQGTVIVAKEGSLRITPEPLALQWSPKPSKKLALTPLEPADNPELIFNDLGVYTGKPFGVPCDDM